MTQIHPTAIIAAGAELGADVEVGPFCVIGPHVRLGDRCRLQSHVRLDGWTELGPDCFCAQGAVVGTDPQDLKFRNVRSWVRAGARNTFREYCTVNRATGEDEVTALGDDNLIMAYAHVAHNCVVGNHVILANSANLAGHVTVEDYVIIGGVTPVHQFVHLGEHCIIGGGCRVPKDVTPYVTAAGQPLRVAGLNTVGLTRRGFSAETMHELRNLYRIFFSSDLIKEEALARIRAECRPIPEVVHFCNFVESSARGLTR